MVMRTKISSTISQYLSLECRKQQPDDKQEQNHEAMNNKLEKENRIGQEKKSSSTSARFLSINNINSLKINSRVAGKERLRNLRKF